MSDTHEHDWQLAKLQGYHSTWACYCGLIEVVDVRKNDE